MNELQQTKPTTVEEFARITKQSFGTQGYLTEKINSFLSGLETVQTETDISENILNIAKDVKDKLQNFSLTVAVLHNFSLPSNIKQEIAQAALEFLKNEYQQPELNLTQYAIDARLAAWNLLTKTVSGQTEEQKKEAGELASKIGDYEPENDTVQTLSVKYNLAIAGSGNLTT